MTDATFIYSSEIPSPTTKRPTGEFSNQLSIGKNIRNLTVPSIYQISSRGGGKGGVPSLLSLSVTVGGEGKTEPYTPRLFLAGLRNIVEHRDYIRI